MKQKQSNNNLIILLWVLVGLIAGTCRCNTPAGNNPHNEFRRTNPDSAEKYKTDTFLPKQDSVQRDTVIPRLPNGYSPPNG